MAQAGDDRCRGPLHRARRGPESACELSVHHPRFALQRIPVETDDNAESKPVTAALAPPQILNVRVTYADTGQPVPHSPLQVRAGRGRLLIDESETDDEGRPASIPGRRNALRRHGLSPGRAAVSHCQRAGRLAQRLRSSRPSISPCRGASWSMARSRRRVPASPPGGPCRFRDRAGARGDQELSMSVRTDSDGSFRLGAEPESGHLFIRGPDDDLRVPGHRLPGWSWKASRAAAGCTRTPMLRST